MRTTLTLDPDVAQELKVRMTARKTSFKEVVNETLRQGLAVKPKSKPREVFRIVPHSFGFKAGIDVNKLNQLVDELEVQEFVAKQRRNRKAR
jgi:hypothetical protein